MNGWVLGGTTFLASAVEMVEAATIVLAVGITQGWRTALTGAAWAFAALAVIVIAFGPILSRQGAITWLELIVGPFMILFGMTWLRKAIWRAAGRKAMRDEQALFDKNIAVLQAARDHRVGFATSFQGVFVEGLEVAVIVVTFAATQPTLLGWSIWGAVAAAIIVILAAIALRAPFARVPENAIKAIVGVMLLSLGTLWTGEGLGLQWWAGDATLFWFIGIYVAAATLLTLAERKPVTA